MNPLLLLDVMVYGQLVGIGVLFGMWFWEEVHHA
jgi:hypothetical protein